MWGKVARIGLIFNQARIEGTITGNRQPDTKKPADLDFHPRSAGFRTCRDDRIRTCDPLTPRHITGSAPFRTTVQRLPQGSYQQTYPSSIG